MKTETEEVIFVEFWPDTLDPFEVITEVHEDDPPRPTWHGYHWYDCAVRTEDKALLIDCSGSGPAPLFTDELLLSHHGAYWVRPDHAQYVKHVEGNVALAELPEALNVWPPPGSVEGKIIECPECGYLSDDGTIDDNDLLCPHLEWDDEERDWVPLGEAAHEYDVDLSATLFLTFRVRARNEAEAEEKAKRVYEETADVKSTRHEWDMGEVTGVVRAD